MKWNEMKWDEMEIRDKKKNKNKKIFYKNFKNEKN